LTSFLSFIRDPQWDMPFFKRLAHNDTGQARGHQGGLVLPKDLRRFLPTLDPKATSRIAPTVDRRLQTEMYVGAEHVADGDVRYQIQTWHGTRPPESRVTDGLGPLRTKARANDILIFQRSVDSLDRFRLILVRQGTALYSRFNRMAANRRWGSLAEAVPPVSQDDISQANREFDAAAEGPFQLQTAEARRKESLQARLARNAAFRERVRIEYGGTCAVSGISLQSPSGLCEVESAHVVPVSDRGADDVRNGMALTRTIHWAFDRGLLGVRPDRVIYVPRLIRRLTANSFLARFHGKRIAEAQTATLRVHPDALAWHYVNRVKRWD